MLSPEAVIARLSDKVNGMRRSLIMAVARDGRSVLFHSQTVPIAVEVARASCP